MVEVTSEFQRILNNQIAMDERLQELLSELVHNFEITPDASLPLTYVLERLTYVVTGQ